MVPDPERTLDRALIAGVSQMVIIGVDPADWTLAADFCDRHAEVFCAFGWHPTHTQTFNRGELQALKEKLNHPSCVALGEIGLDFYWKDYATPAQQYDALTPQLDLAAEMNLPCIFHARDATAALLDVLEARPWQPYLFHCFAGDLTDAERCLQLGAYLGIGGPLTYKKNELLRQVARDYPRNRIVLETDSPYLSPEPLRKNPNEPANIPVIGRKLAEVWQESEAETARITTENARELFRR